MMQIKLMKLSQSLNEGDAIVIPYDDMREGAKGNLKSMLFDSVRENDIEQFAHQMESNWGVEMVRNHETGNYTMYKPKDRKGNTLKRTEARLLMKKLDEMAGMDSILEDMQ